MSGKFYKLLRNGQKSTVIVSLEGYEHLGVAVDLKLTKQEAIKECEDTLKKNDLYDYHKISEPVINRIDIYAKEKNKSKSITEKVWWFKLND